ncbi:hypothetical protein [Microbacterium halophytorum]|nr:hypothetical protein [Microbacterium halophytorum]
MDDDTTPAQETGTCADGERSFGDRVAGFLLTLPAAALLRIGPF